MTVPFEQAPARRREVVTPEGVPLAFTVADAGDRAGAFVLDLLLVWAGLLALLVPFGFLLASGKVEGDLVFALVLLLFFVLRSFYFAFFELAWQGQTPGKRRLGLRAVDGRGGPLTAEAVLARNLTREVELFLPMVALAAPGSLWPGAPGLVVLAAMGWMLLFGLLPLFNRDRLRVGDLLAGTLVIRVPQAVLLVDLAHAPGAALPFSDEQLDVYGVYELQVLEQVLRTQGHPGGHEALATVAAKVREKIGWQGPWAPDGEFLQAFYAALRQRLEKRLLFGRRRADKHDRSA